MIKKIILTVTISFFALLSSCVKINTLYENYEQLEEKVLILEGEISKLTSALNSTTQALETATANYNNLQSSSDTQVSQLLALIANLQDEKDSLEDELNIVKTSLVQLQVDVTGLTGENNSLLETITSLTAQIEALEQTSGSSTDTNSNNVSEIDFPDYKNQGHSMKAIGVWRVLSISGLVVEEANRFNVLIYPDPSNPNKLTDAGNSQTGWLDFNTSKKISWLYNQGRLGSSSAPVTGLFRIDDSEINGIETDAGVYLQYFPEIDGQSEYLYYDYNGNNTTYDQNIFPKGLRRIKFYRLK
ncbi:hypothetical protein N8374_06375 [Flavobacteriaceae bacterium]|nr:hypothetical protein [Flavobacteriaceae bacterium]